MTQITRKKKQALWLVFVAAAASLSHGAFALDLSYRPQLRIGMRASDNVRSSAVSPEAALGFDNGGGLELKAESQVWKSLITPSFNFRRFAIGEDLDADEYGVRSQHQWFATERLMLGTNVDYVRDSTLTTELTDAGVQNQVANRDTVLVQPNVTYIWDDRTSLTAGYLHQDVSFDTDARGQLIDYLYDQVNVGATHAWREHLTFSITAFASKFETPDLEGETRTYGGQGGAEYRFSPDFSMNLAVGYVTSDIDFQNRFLALDPGPPPRIVVVSREESVSTNGPIANVSIRKDFERLRTRFDYARRVSPSIRGTQQVEDDILFTAEHDLTQTWRVGFRGGYNMRSSELQDTDAIQSPGTSNQLNRDQALVAGWIAYAFTKELSVRSEYRFVRNSFDENVRRDPIYGNALFLNLIFNGEPHFLRGF